MSDIPDIHYFHWIDVAKGIGIILVILGHCIFPCHALIDIFHMPLFFVLAGVTFHSKQSGEFVLGKINRIFVPYVFWAVISAILNFIPHNYGGVFNGPLWFLPVMFSTLILIFIISKVNKNSQMAIICLCAFLSWLFVEMPSIAEGLPFSLNLVLLSAFYMYIGYKTGHYLKSENKKQSRIFVTLILVVLFILIFSWLFQNYNLQGAYVSQGLYRSNFIVVLICSIFGIFATLYISKLIGKSDILEWMGKNSLVLMCVHFPFSNSFNVFVAGLPMYNSLEGKVFLALVEYILVFSISVILTISAKKYLNRVTGYSPLIQLPSYTEHSAC